MLTNASSFDNCCPCFGAHAGLQPSLPCCICWCPVCGYTAPDVLAVPTLSVLAKPRPPPCCHLWDFTWALSTSVSTPCESCLAKSPPHLCLQPDLPSFVTAGRRSREGLTALPPHPVNLCEREATSCSPSRHGAALGCQCNAQPSGATLACLGLSVPSCHTEIMQAVYFVLRAVVRPVKHRQCSLEPLKGSPKVGYFYKIIFRDAGGSVG